MATPTPRSTMPTNRRGSRRRSSRRDGTVMTSSGTSGSTRRPIEDRPYTPMFPRLDAGTYGHGSVGPLEGTRHRRLPRYLRQGRDVSSLGASDAHGGDVETL